MEPLGSEWDSLNFSRMFSTEDLDVMQQVVHQFSFPPEDDEGLMTFLGPWSSSSAFCPTPEVINTTMSGAIDTKSLYFSPPTTVDSFLRINYQDSQSSNSNSKSFMATNNHEINSYYLHHVPEINNDINMSGDISMDVDGISEEVTGSAEPFQLPAFPEETATYVNEDLKADGLENLSDAKQTAVANEFQLKRKFELTGVPAADTIINNNKRPRVSRKVRNNNVQSKRKRNDKLNNYGEMNNNVGSDGQSSSSYSSDDEKASQETNGGTISDPKAFNSTLNSNGKTRACRGSATDPQSLYARKRRERINERLRILQNLVPNGTKVDISTMLEEAVHYVKFLQLQIKLLSSDDLWMYAPIAYNGIDIGLNKKISMLL